MHFKFKKNVLAYKSVNDYIFNKNKPLIYTKKYFESLQSMDTHEIVVFLKIILLKLHIIVFQVENTEYLQ